MGYIYKITNLINNKIYVGQTRFDYQKRFKRHLFEAKRGVLNYPLYRAIRKYGEENFKIECIEEIDDNLLNERECFWIKELNSYAKNNKGYNATYGGEGNSNIDKLEIYELWDSSLSIQEIAEKTGHDRSSIRKILQDYENYSIEESQKRGDKAQTRKRFKKIKQYSLQGEYINTFDNATEAERQTNISHKTIWGVLNHVQKTAGGFQWRYEDDLEPIQDLSKRKAVIRKIKQINNNNQEIKIYDNIPQAVRETGITYNRILRCCTKNVIMLPENYKWEYVEN